jgi:hypothetical protein
MDKERFDSLARAMASGKSRRDVLKLLAGGAAGSALVVTAFDDATAECHNIACSSDAGCCAGAPYCVGGVCATQMAAEPPAQEESSGTTSQGETVSDLGDPGIGPDAGASSGAWMGAALAGGAAALFASKVLRRNQDEAEDSA